MKYDDIKKMRITDVMGARVRYQSPDTMRRRIGVVYGIDFRGLVVINQRKGYKEPVAYGLIDEILEVKHG
ncbi:MAG: hypothetical protein WC373_12580 [Smithella sp.]|jgi:hypothetical protein